MTEIMNSYMNGGFLVDFVTVIVANIVLSGDNAVVIALAARSLPKTRRVQGIVLGNIVAILVRVVLTYSAAMLLKLPHMKFCGGVLILCIAVKLLIDKEPGSGYKERSGGLLKVVSLIGMADLFMSVDNVLAVAGASKGNLALLVLGLSLSIPLVAFGSGIISWLMGRFPVMIFIGAAILGKVAAEMIIADPLVLRFIQTPGHFIQYSAQVMLALAVIGAGKLWLRIRESRKRTATRSLIWEKTH